MDPDTEVIKRMCQDLVGKEFVLSLSLESRTLPLDKCDGLNNAVGCLLEQIICLLFANELSCFEQGNRQRSPDFYNRNKYEYELKCFEKHAGFDISSYNAYIDQIVRPNGVCRKLFHTTYLVFRYELRHCRIIIKQFWMSNIWNLVGYDGKYPISIQNKRGIWYNIRPSSPNNWGSGDAKKFVHHLIESVMLCPNPLRKDAVIDAILKQLPSLLE